MNLYHRKSRFLFATPFVFVAISAAVLLGGFIAKPANAATDGWHIKDDATGGECSVVGAWNAGSKTCTLSQDLSQGIIIDSDNIILDGSGRMITVIAGSNPGSGVYLYGRVGVTIKNLNVKGFSYGISLTSSSGNTIAGNTASNNINVGVFLLSSNNNTLTSNTASNNNFWGIYIAHSSNNTLTGNTAQENRRADVYVGGSLDGHCNNTIIDTTGSGGRPIKYFNGAVNLSNETLSELILCNADGSRINNITIDGSSMWQNNGLFLVFTDYSTIANINSSNNWRGILLDGSNNNTLTSNVASNNDSGVFLSSSNNNTLTSNTASNNNGGVSVFGSNGNVLMGNTTASNDSVGVFLAGSNNNTLTSNVASNNSNGVFILSSNGNVLMGNTVSNNSRGVVLGSSNNNQIYKNNFINNSTQAFIPNTDNNGNVFNLTTPVGGNYWSNYDTPAESCNDANNDGFCDAPYVFTGGQDNLPWIKQDGWIAPEQKNLLNFPFFNGALADTISFGYPGVRKIAQSFKLTAEAKISKINVILVRDSTDITDGLRMHISDDLNNTLAVSDVVSSAGMPVVISIPPPTTSFMFPAMRQPTLQPGRMYYFIIERTGPLEIIPTTKVYTNLRASATSATYSDGMYHFLTTSSLWISQPEFDFFFQVYGTPITPANHQPTLSFLKSSPDGLFEDDGIRDKKGTAGKTQFDFRVVYKDQDNNAPSSVRLAIEKVNNGGYEGYLDLEMSRFCPLCPQDYTNDQIYVVASNDLEKSLTFPQGNYRYRFEASDGVSNVQTLFTKFTVGYSNVAFLPGLEASRLYRRDSECAFLNCENQLWEPNRNGDVEKLYLSPTTGESLDSSIYTRDVIDEALRSVNGPNIYKSFIEDMDALVAAGTIHAWEPLPYDWRFDFDALLSKGVKDGDNISYILGTSTPFILQELHHLAETSDTGKVTIITHSNGGLLAKYLLATLGKNNDPLEKKIDTVIMVAAPQVGTPKAIAGLLHGDEAGLGAGIILTDKTARALAENMPSAYNLLPSAQYFNTVQSPVLIFDENVNRVAELTALSNTTIATASGLELFLRGQGGLWNEPNDNDLDTPNVLKNPLLTKAKDIHGIIDGWIPPSGMQVVQIAGWGIDTIKEIRYSCPFLTCHSLSTLDRSINSTTLDGDETVVVPSASWMSTSSPNVERWWVNLFKYNDESFFDRDHSNILEVGELQNFIKSIITGGRAADGTILTNVRPIADKADKRLRFTLHSPVDIHLYDSFGNHTGLLPNINTSSDVRRYEKNIPNSYYREFGEAKYAGVSAGTSTIVKLQGLALGSFTLDIDEIAGDSTITASTTFIDIPVASSTKATLAIQNIQTTSALQFDIEGDGVIDFSLTPSQGANPVISLSVFERVVRTLGFEKGTTQSIIAKIAAAKNSLERGNKEATLGQMNALANYLRAQTGKKLNAATVETLIEILGRIQASVVK